MPIPAILVVRRGGRGQVDVVELRVIGHPVPHVGVPGVLGRPVQPGLIARLVLLRDGMERPELLSRPDIVRLDVAGRHLLRAETIGDRIADDNHVPRDQGAPRREVRPSHRIPNPDHDVDGAALAEVRIRLAGPGIDRDQPGRHWRRARGAPRCHRSSTRGPGAGTRHWPVAQTCTFRGRRPTRSRWLPGPARRSGPAVSRCTGARSP